MVVVFYIAMYDLWIAFYLHLKPEKELQLRYDREKLVLKDECIGIIKDYLQDNLKHKNMRGFEYTKMFVENLRETMMLDEYLR
mmetsp:Transcript_44552/g.43211  ORF Transcript_44552/g.43211 Transcript_44552/m.43211 type:complete len:83 (+) Transcript_44552:1352-1600(+)